MAIRHSLLVAGLMLQAGCSDGALPPAHSADDPSNPSAPEVPFMPGEPAPPAAPVAPASTAAPHHHGAMDAPPVVGSGLYVCPMHADVVRDAPGTCPRCGMTLVPKPGAGGSAQ